MLCPNCGSHSLEEREDGLLECFNCEAIMDKEYFEKMAYETDED